MDFVIHHLVRQAKVMGRAGLADRQQAPAHPRGCPHTAHRKRSHACTACLRKQKPQTICMARLLRLLISGPPSPDHAYGRDRSIVPKSLKAFVFSTTLQAHRRDSSLASYSKKI